MKSPLLFCCLACAAVTPALADSGDDFGLWTEATVQKAFSKSFSIDGGLEFRLDDKFSQPSRWAVSAGASYKPLKYLSLGASYVFIHDYKSEEVKAKYETDDETGSPELDDAGRPVLDGYNVEQGYWRNRHRALLEVTGKVEAGRFTFSLRERYQYTRYVGETIQQHKFRNPIPEVLLPSFTGSKYEYAGTTFSDHSVDPDVKESKDKHYLRSRLQVEYNINHCHWTPYVSYELVNDLQDKFDLEKGRLKVGAEWKITKKHRLDVAYLWDKDADDESNSNHHVISLGYKFKF